VCAQWAAYWVKAAYFQRVAVTAPVGSQRHGVGRAALSAACERSRQTARATHTALDLAIAHFQQNSTKNEQISSLPVPYSIPTPNSISCISGVASGGDLMPKMLECVQRSVDNLMLPFLY